MGPRRLHARDVLERERGNRRRSDDAGVAERQDRPRGERREERAAQVIQLAAEIAENAETKKALTRTENFVLFVPRDDGCLAVTSVDVLPCLPCWRFSSDVGFTRELLQPRSCSCRRHLRGLSKGRLSSVCRERQPSDRVQELSGNAGGARVRISLVDQHRFLAADSHLRRHRPGHHAPACGERRHRHRQHGHWRCRDWRPGLRSVDARRRLIRSVVCARWCRDRFGRIDRRICGGVRGDWRCGGRLDVRRRRCRVRPGHDRPSPLRSGSRRLLPPVVRLRHRAAAMPMTATADDLCFMSGRDLAALIRSRKVSSRDVMAAHLGKSNASIPSSMRSSPSWTIGTVWRSPRKPTARCCAHDRVGPLHGLPWAFKDLEAVVGFPFTNGSPIFQSNMPTENTLLVERIRAAGAIPIGKTNVPEFGMGSHTYNRVYGITRNPYDTAKSAGGSSGGAAAAVAAGLLPLADGSDLGGSLRNPASFNNVVGFRPSVGLVPTAPTTLPFLGFGVKGPIARSVGDVAFLMSVMAGSDRRDPGAYPSDPSTFAHAARARFQRRQSRLVPGSWRSSARPSRPRHRRSPAKHAGGMRLCGRRRVL